MRILRLDRFAIYATDPARSERFYRGRPGTEVHARIGAERLIGRFCDTE